MLELDYTKQGRRPSAKQIFSDWKKADCPKEFTVTYGETFAEFNYVYDRWDAHGNGCRGVDRDAVLYELNFVQA